jgi:hypothetical protein
VNYEGAKKTYTTKLGNKLIHVDGNHTQSYTIVSKNYHNPGGRITDSLNPNRVYRWKTLEFQKTINICDLRYPDLWSDYSVKINECKILNFIDDNFDNVEYIIDFLASREWIMNHFFEEKFKTYQIINPNKLDFVICYEKVFMNVNLK